MGMPITFEQAGSILATMGFLSETVTPEKEDYHLFQQMWEILEHEEGKGVSVDDLAYVL